MLHASLLLAWHVVPDTERGRSDRMEPKDLNLLTPEVAAASISDREIVLPYELALEAIDMLGTGGYAVVSWEGWLLFQDGSMGHSFQHQGTVGLERYPDESAQEFIARASIFVRQTMEQSQLEWNRKPTRANARLYCCLAIEPCND